MRFLATADFLNAANSHRNPTAFRYIPNVQVNEFLTKDDFYRPNDSEYINSFTDLDGRNVRVYTFNLSKCILILSQESPDKFKHFIYTTDREEGFLLKEVFEIAAVFGL